MRVISSLNKFREYRLKYLSDSVHKIGFVPTMGALHKGHITLVENAKKGCDKVVVSIFVNPTQFAPHEDLQKYPRPLQEDIRLLEEANVDCLFIPVPEEIYPKNYSTYVDVGLDHTREGKARPGHFKGVATVVSKLFNIVQPNEAFFGQKDAIQCILIKKLQKDLNFPLKVTICPTLREQDGLAMSSRNRYLDPEDRKLAPIFSKSLFHGQKLYDQGVRDINKILSEVKNILKDERIRIEYIGADDFETGSSIEKITDQEHILLSGAIFIGKTRLIDNVILSRHKD